MVIWTVIMEGNKHTQCFQQRQFCVDVNVAAVETVHPEEKSYSAARGEVKFTRLKGNKYKSAVYYSAHSKKNLLAKSAGCVLAVDHV